MIRARRPGTLHTFHVAHRLDDEDESLFVAQAEDANHAAEQCRNAHPLTRVLRIDQVGPTDNPIQGVSDLIPYYEIEQEARRRVKRAITQARAEWEGNGRIGRPPLILTRAGQRRAFQVAIADELKRGLSRVTIGMNMAQARLRGKTQRVDHDEVQRALDNAIADLRTIALRVSALYRGMGSVLSE